MISPIIIPKHTTAPTARLLNEKGYKDAFYQNCFIDCAYVLVRNS